jgi:hypothetical protein
VGERTAAAIVGDGAPGGGGALAAPQAAHSASANVIGILRKCDFVTVVPFLAVIKIQRLPLFLAHATILYALQIEARRLYYVELKAVWQDWRSAHP